MAISIPDIKTLFALSRNVCAYPGCEERLTDPQWPAVKAEMAHICGEKPNAPRHDPSMSPTEREGYSNRILLCPNHHVLIDRLDPEGHPAALLREMKSRHELVTTWATDAELETLATIALEQELAVAEGGGTPIPDEAPPEDGRFGNPYGYERGEGFLTLTVPVPEDGDNGSGSLSHSMADGAGAVIEVLADTPVSAVGHLLGVDGTVRTGVLIRDVTDGREWEFSGTVSGVPAIPIYEGTWAWFDCPVDFTLQAAHCYEIRPTDWTVEQGSPLNENNWHFLMPFLRDTEGRAFDEPFMVGESVRVVDGTFRGSRITGLPPLSLTLA